MSRDQDQFLETANHLGVMICRDALWAGDRCNWLGPSMEYTGNLWSNVHKAYGADLYGGTSGIALFLSHLYAATKEKIFRSVAEGALNHCLSRVDNFHSSVRSGFYSGCSGIAYALQESADQLGDERFAAEALRLTKSFTQDDPNEQPLDVISGSAGAIPAMLYMQRKHPGDFLIELATKHGEHLLTTARKSTFGWSWNTMESPLDLTGFSHGAAGIAWALLELHKETGEDRFRAAAEEAFSYERHYYNAEQENWPDFRSFTNQNPAESMTVQCSVTWCHGAPGIGLSRLRAYELTGQEHYRSEAEAAVRSTAKMLSAATHGWADNFSLCHGLAGNAELLAYASQVLADESHLSLVYEVGELGIERYLKGKLPWPCGVPGAGESPNLMLGLAGIGYFYLRLYDSSKHDLVLMVLPEK